MKKLFLVVLAAGLFAACGNGNKAEEEAIIEDTVVTEEVVAEEVVAEEPVAEEAVAEEPAKKQTVKEHAKEAGEAVANTAIDAAAGAATQEIQKQKRR